MLFWHAPFDFLLGFFELFLFHFTNYAEDERIDFENFCRFLQELLTSETEGLPIFELDQLKRDSFILELREAGL